MSEIIRLPTARDDKFWAVIAQSGRIIRVANLYPDREAALADCRWRQREVRAYAGLLKRAPSYSVTQLRRADLPRDWRPLPALGFLRGNLI